MSEPSAVISDRYLSLGDRLAIADGLGNKMTLTEIAAGIGKHVSTVSRELKLSTTQAAQHRRPLPALSGPWRCSGKASGVATTP
jgi:IS30 family transposase